MPDLSLEGSHRFWNDFSDPMIYRVVTFMEGVENWTLDGEANLEAAIDALGQQLDNVGDYELGEQEKFIQLVASIKSSRTLRLLQCIDTAHPGAASKLLIHAEETSQTPDDLAGLFLRRNIVFERLRLLSRVFSSERFDIVLKALEGEDE